MSYSQDKTYLDCEAMLLATDLTDCTDWRDASARLDANERLATFASLSTLAADDALERLMEACSLEFDNATLSTLRCDTRLTDARDADSRLTLAAEVAEDLELA